MPLTEIGSHNADDFLRDADLAGFHRGLAPRDFASRPGGYHAAVPKFTDDMLIKPADQQGYLDSQIAAQGSLYDLRNLYYDYLKSLDQDGLGLCWAFSSTKANMYARIKAGLPPAVLSAWYVAGKVKHWHDQGGSADESAAFLAAHGAPTVDFCPKYKSSYDTPECEANAELHQITSWYDGSDNRNRNAQIMISGFLLGGIPVLDFNWLGHSMCGCRLVSINPLVVDADNSWGPTGQYGEKGLYRLTGQHAIPDNLVVVFGTEISMV